MIVSLRLLVGFDGSPAAQRALARAARRAQRHHGCLCVVMVLSHEWYGSLTAIGAAGSGSAIPWDLESAMVGLLQDAVNDLPGDISVTWLARHGPVARVLIEEASARACDAIVVGARGGLVSRFTGGVARELRRHSEIPVVVVGVPRPGWRKAHRRSRRGKRKGGPATPRPA